MFDWLGLIYREKVTKWWGPISRLLFVSDIGLCSSFRVTSCCCWRPPPPTSQRETGRRKREGGDGPSRKQVLSIPATLSNVTELLGERLLPIDQSIRLVSYLCTSDTQTLSGVSFSVGCVPKSSESNFQIPPCVCVPVWSRHRRPRRTRECTANSILNVYINKHTQTFVRWRPYILYGESIRSEPNSRSSISFIFLSLSLWRARFLVMYGTAFASGVMVHSLLLFLLLLLFFYFLVTCIYFGVGIHNNNTTLGLFFFSLLFRL
jgi:hypothetical protein